MKTTTHELPPSVLVTAVVTRDGLTHDPIQVRLSDVASRATIGERIQFATEQWHVRSRAIDSLTGEITIGVDAYRTSAARPPVPRWSREVDVDIAPFPAMVVEVHDTNLVVRLDRWALPVPNKAVEALIAALTSTLPPECAQFACVVCRVDGVRLVDDGRATCEGCGSVYAVRSSIDGYVTNLVKRVEPEPR